MRRLPVIDTVLQTLLHLLILVLVNFVVTAEVAPSSQQCAPPPPPLRVGVSSFTTPLQLQRRCSVCKRRRVSGRPRGACGLAVRSQGPPGPWRHTHRHQRCSTFCESRGARQAGLGRQRCSQHAQRDDAACISVEL
jgi:hypothetical protein